MTDKAKPVRFAKTAVDAPSLSRLSRFLADIAGEQPQCTDGQKEDDAAAKVTDVI